MSAVPSMPAGKNRPPRILLRSSWQVVNIGDIGLGDWLFDFDQEPDIVRHVPAVLELAQNPAQAKAKAAKAREFVELRQHATMLVFKKELSKL